MGRGPNPAKGRRPPASASVTHLKVSRIMVKSTNFPRSGTTSEVGGMISASRRKNTVSESRMEMDRLTCRYLPVWSVCVYTVWRAESFTNC